MSTEAGERSDDTERLGRSKADVGEPTLECAVMMPAIDGVLRLSRLGSSVGEERIRIHSASGWRDSWLVPSLGRPLRSSWDGRK
jgi:hypothetical protein